jgi:hypothetical protein
MKKEFKVALKTLAIKARVFNVFRVKFFNKKLEEFTEKEKVEVFNELFSQVKEAHNELNNYKRKRQYKAKIEALRQETKEHV